MSIQAKFRNGLPVSIAILGDSCGCGFGANPGINKWSDGNSYGVVNQPAWGPNWVSGDTHFLTISGPISQSCQDSLQIPSAYHLLRRYVQGANPESKVYNRSASGWACSDHVASGSVAVLASLDPKPEVVIIALGINDAKNKQSQVSAMRTLITQCLSHGMVPVISKGHNVACDPATGASSETLPNTWVSMPYWLNMRAGMESLAAEFDLETIDPGTPDNAIDTSLLYDHFHPSKKGHRRIFEAYRAWLGTSIMIAGHRFSHNPTGEVRIGNFRLKLGESGPVRIVTPEWVKSLS